ncbi:MAG: type II secretion system protein [Deltaproteobacteria bacterium]|nr:type II secretion system protein [Deltaproteobacteria bacterium]
MTKCRFKRELGFTVVEVLVSMVIFGIVMASLPAVFLTHARINQRMEIKAEAMAAGQQIMDGFRAADPITLPASGVGADQVTIINDHNYVVEPTFCENVNFCKSESNRHIKLRIFNEGEEVAQLETVFTRLK